MLRFIFIACAVVTVGLTVNPEPGFSTKETALKQLEKSVIHFAEIEPGVYRSGLIPEAAAPLLEELGVKTVINFDNLEERARKEAAHLKLFGIYTVWMPWSGWGDPSTEEVDKFLSLMKTPDLRPIWIHCKRGSERTGTMMAIWRIDSGWPVEKAYQEMRKFEYRRFFQGHLKRYVYRYAREHGQPDAEIKNRFEHLKTNFFSGIFQMRKWNPFLKTPKPGEALS
jgi:tyrosine-protein phosphatase SIW14